VLKGEAKREACQSMARWVADNPPFPGRAYKQWIAWMYKENRLVNGGLRLRGRRVDLHRIEQNTLVVTAGVDHIAPRAGTLPLLDMGASEDVTHLDRAGGHIGLMAGLRAREGDLAGHRGVARGALRNVGVWVRAGPGMRKGEDDRGSGSHRGGPATLRGRREA
jgi:hypothetical protein